MSEGPKRKSLGNHLLKGRQGRRSADRDRERIIGVAYIIKSVGSQKPREKSYKRSNSF